MPSALQKLCRISCIFFLSCGITPVGAQPVRVQDDSGALVQLAAPAQRVVTLAPHLTEILYAAGAGRSLVGTVRHADFPDAAKSVPRLGDALHVNVEALLALQPDLVLAWQSGNSPVLLQRLEELGLVVHRSESPTLDSVARTMEQIGVLIGKEHFIAPVAGSYRQHLHALRVQYARAAPVPTFYQVWSRPLISVNDTHLIGQALTVCGAQNVFGSVDVPVPQVSLEAVLAAQPAVILHGAPPGGESSLQRFWAAHAEIPAVAAGRVHAIPADWVSRPGPRLLLGVQEICRVLDAARGGSTP